MSDTPFSFVISSASAPLNTSCQRSPSVMTKMTFCVLCSAAAAMAQNSRMAAVAEVRRLSLGIDGPRDRIDLSEIGILELPAGSGGVVLHLLGFGGAGDDGCDGGSREKP